MLILKKANLEDFEKEFEAIKKIPKEENGYSNRYYNVTKEEFKNICLPEIIARSEGKNLSKGKVAQTYYFLWDDDEIVGLFKIRHYLNDFLRKGPGHIGYGILKEYRGKKYATRGLKLAIDICKDLIKEGEIYLSVDKDNIPSLKAQQKNGAYIVSENEKEYFTRIKLNK